MKDIELVRFMRMMNDMEQGKIEVLNKQEIYEANCQAMEGLFKTNIDNTLNENSAEIGTMFANAFKSVGKSLGSVAKAGIERLGDKLAPAGYEDSIARDVLDSYKDELGVIKNKHMGSLSMFSKEFWSDVFNTLGVEDSKIEADFLKTQKANLVDLKKDSDVVKKKLLDALKEVNVEDNGKTINVFRRYKTLPALMASKYKKIIMANDNVASAMKEYKTVLENLYKTRFGKSMGELIQAMTVDYIAKKNAKLKAKDKDTVEEWIGEGFCRFTLYEEQYLILLEDENLGEE